MGFGISALSRYSVTVLTTGLLGIALYGAGRSAGAADATPIEIVEATSQAVSETLEGRRDYLEQNPQELYAAVNGILLPIFDVRYAGYLVMGSHWKTATDEQKTGFVDAFYNYLLRSYAMGLLDYDEQSVAVLPADQQPKGKSKRTMIKTEMTTEEGKIVPVNYSLRKSKAYHFVFQQMA